MVLEISHSREPVSEQDIISLESVLGAQLPDTYRKFLLLHNGGHPNPNVFPIHNNPSDNRGQIDYFLCIKVKDIYNLPTWIRRYKNRIPHDLIPIAVDPGGNLICLSIMDINRGKIYFWDHEEEADDGNAPGYGNIYLITNTFDELLNFLIS